MSEVTRTTHIRDGAIEVGEIEGYEYFVVRSPCRSEEALNGYVVFPVRPVRERGYGGILNYVPVHGGITYAEEDDRGMVYGFDTLHCDSDKKPRTDPRWIKAQCQIMLAGVLKAAEVEAKYLRCISNRGKAKHAQAVQDVVPEGGREDLGFGAMINLLSGEL